MNAVAGNEVYRKLMTLMMYSKRRMCRALLSDMTPVQASLLMLFEPGEAKSMNTLSCMMGCDASNITGLVDRLEANKLIERTTDPVDRRVKMIMLSSKGEQYREQVLQSMQQSESIDLAKLDDDERAELIRLIDKLTREL